VLSQGLADARRAGHSINHCNPAAASVAHAYRTGQIRKHTYTRLGMRCRNAGRSRAAAFVLSLLATSIACRGTPAPVERPSGPTLVVANQDEGVASLIDLTGGRVLGDIDVDMDPHEAAVSPDGRTVALASPSTWRGSANKVAILDVATATLSKTIDLGEHKWPHGVAFRDAQTLLVGSRDSAAVLVVDVASGRITRTIDNGGAGPYLLHVVHPTQRAYTSNPTNNAVTEIDLQHGTLLRRWDNPDAPAGLGVSPGGETLWFARGVDGPQAVSVIDLSTGAIVNRFEGFTHARRFAFTPDGAKVAISDGDHLRVFDARAQKEVGRVPLGEDAGASGVTFDPSGARCYVALSGAGAAAEIDVARLAVTRRFTLREGADGIAFVPLK
jgi:DNA-binding beta-propeller fold protein YncE